MNYFLGSLNGDYRAYKAVKDFLNLEHGNTLWILGDIFDSDDFEPEDSVNIFYDIMRSKNIKLCIGDHEFLHIMRRESTSNRKNYEIWLKFLTSMEPSGAPLISYLDAMDDEECDILFQTLKDRCEISHLLHVGNRYFYVAHGFPVTDRVNLTGWQLSLVTNESLNTDHYAGILNDPTISSDKKKQLTAENTIVICSHNNPTYDLIHKKNVFVLPPVEVDENITILGLDAAGFFTRILPYPD